MVHCIFQCNVLRELRASGIAFVSCVLRGLRAPESSVLREMLAPRAECGAICVLLEQLASLAACAESNVRHDSRPPRAAYSGDATGLRCTTGGDAL